MSALTRLRESALAWQDLVALLVYALALATLLSGCGGEHEASAPCVLTPETVARFAKWKLVLSCDEESAHEASAVESWDSRKGWTR